MRKKIFISSTFRDLKTHRDEIWKRLQNLDVDILGMESFGARKSSPIETCLEEVEKCDIYIGIVSMCAGTIHPLFKKSYTEIEYDRALSLNKDIWIYLLNEEDGILLSGNIDFGERQDYLKGLKNRLKEKHTIDFFKNENDLGDKIFKRLNEILPKERTIVKRPDIIDCKVFNFKSPNYYWFIFVGYLDYKPYELFSGINDDNSFGILLPHSVESGKAIKSIESDGLIRYDFQYVNKQGYRTTIEGINYPFIPEVSASDRQISKLLQNDVDSDLIIDIISEIHTNNEDQLVWKANLVKILGNNK